MRFSIYPSLSYISIGIIFIKYPESSRARHAIANRIFNWENDFIFNPNWKQSDEDDDDDDWDDNRKEIFEEKQSTLSCVCVQLFRIHLIIISGFLILNLNSRKSFYDLTTRGRHKNYQFFVLYEVLLVIGIRLGIRMYAENLKQIFIVEYFPLKNQNIYTCSIIYAYLLFYLPFGGWNISWP